MKCFNCNTEMKKFPNMRGLKQDYPMIILEDDFEEDGILIGRCDTLKISEEEKYYINPVYSICPNCGFIAKFVDKNDIKKIFLEEDIK